MLSKSQKRVVLGTAMLVVAVLFVVPAINVSRYRLSVAQALSEAVGRQVTVQGISIQTFPQPGLLLTGVAVGDEPSISAEPMLRADEVLAVIRLSSLWRGRLEIATLKLKYPSLNLVRANDGRWNLESLIDRARQTPSAPTAKSRPEARPRFPYIESDGGRINLKIGNEKKVFALSEADFAVWLAAEDEWRMRLEARPIRTDANLSDTGTLRVEGSWRRAPQLHETPISLDIRWDYGQLGQLTRLAYGRDRGWRGRMTASVSVNGKPEDLKFRLDARLDDFRRYDIASSDSVTLELHCNSEYNFTAKQVKNLACQMPAGSGVVLAHGSYAFLPQRRVDVSVSAENVPMQFLVSLARHAKRDLPNDINVSGMMSAAFAIRSEGSQTTLAGNGETSPAEVRSNVLGRPLKIESTRWALTGPGANTEAKTKEKKANCKRHTCEPAQPAVLTWKVEPFALRLGGEAPATFSAWFGHETYFTEIKGDFDVARVFEVAKLSGLPATKSEITGSAKGSVQVYGSWAGFSAPTVSAAVQLKNVTAKLGGVADPVHINTGQFLAGDNKFGLTKASITIPGLHSNLQFNGGWTTHCGMNDFDTPQSCGLNFDLTADQLNIDEINALLNPKAQKRPWYAEIANTMIGAQSKTLPELHANGYITASKVFLKSATLTHFSSAVELKPTGFSLRSIAADVFGGKYIGELQADFHSGQPTYISQGRLQKVGMGSIAALMKDNWASGTVNATYEGRAVGWNADELLSSASGSSTFDWHEGAFAHIDLDGQGKPLQFRLFTGRLELKAGSLSIDQGKLQYSGSIYLVSGTASMDRQLELKLTRDGTPGYSVSGPLERPVIAPVKLTATQAKLKQSRHP